MYSYERHWSDLEFRHFSNPTFTIGASHNNVAYVKQSDQGNMIRLTMRPRHTFSVNLRSSLEG